MLFGNKVIKTGSQWTRVAIEHVLPPVARANEIDRATRLLRDVMRSADAHQGVQRGVGPYTVKRINNDLLTQIVEFLAERGQEL